MSAHLGRRDPQKQGHRTPPEFLAAVERRFGAIVFDLAATWGDQVTGDEGPCWTPAHDSLSRNWGDQFHKGTHFLNPPYSKVEPWMRKLHDECRLLPRWTVALVQASSDSKWWHSYVHNKCMVFDIPRVKFVGESSVFPKPLACLAYGYGVSGRAFWNWRAK